jgi:hypothetical protein
MLISGSYSELNEANLSRTAALHKSRSMVGCTDCNPRAWRSEVNKGKNRGIRSNTFYEVRPLEDHRGVELISERLPFRRLW